MDWGSLTGEFEGKVRFCLYQKCVKGGSGKGYLSPQVPRWGTWAGGGPFTGNFESKLMLGSGDGVSLSMGALRSEPGGVLFHWGYFSQVMTSSRDFSLPS